MADQIDGQSIRRVILEIVSSYSGKHDVSMQTGVVLRTAKERLGAEQNDEELDQALLTFWHDLFRTGHLAWGKDVWNADPPFCHVTERGRRALQNLSRDPANQDGYMAHLSNRGNLGPVTESYVREALKTYSSDCHKAAAVMAGVAAESVVLELRDVLVARLGNLGRPIPSRLKHWQIKQVLTAFKSELDRHNAQMPVPLREMYESYWSTFTQLLRSTRNEAGHLTSVEPVTQDGVQASLLVFPELFKLAEQLKAWISSHSF